MPVFHTKTIESILEPVAQQVSRLIILHEEAEDGNAMPDLSRPVQAVKLAVDNLVQIGYQTTNTSTDAQMKQDMPPALERVERSADWLLEASQLLAADPFSALGRKKLIEGARGILQGTSSLLLAFDESEVRKIIAQCKAVNEYLSITEVIDNLTDLVTFVKNISPGLTQMSKQVDEREKDLTHQAHRTILQHCLQGVRDLTPVLISSIKVYITTNSSQSPATEDARENRNFTVKSMCGHIQEIIRVLQLTSVDSDDFAVDDAAAMRNFLMDMQARRQAAHDWLSDPTSEPGGIGEQAVTDMVSAALAAAERCPDPEIKKQVEKAVSDIKSMVAALNELKANGQGDTTQAHALARSIEHKLDELQSIIAAGAEATEKAGARATARTLRGRIDEARAWLNSGNPQNGRPNGEAAARKVIADSRRIAMGLPPGQIREELLALCDEAEQQLDQLCQHCNQGTANSPQAKALAQMLSHRLGEIEGAVNRAICDKVVDAFLDVNGPIKALSAAALAPLDTPNREQNYLEKAEAFDEHSSDLAQTAVMVAYNSATQNKATLDDITSTSKQVTQLAPQVVRAGRVVLVNPSDDSTKEHFDIVKKQWTDNSEKLRILVDENTDSLAFIRATEAAILKDTASIESSIVGEDPQGVVDNAANIARRTNRLIQLAQQEVDNSEDAAFRQDITAASEKLKTTMPQMVRSAKALTMNPRDEALAQAWRSKNDELLDCVRDMRMAVEAGQAEPMPPPLSPRPPPIPDVSSLSLGSPSPVYSKVRKYEIVTPLLTPPPNAGYAVFGFSPTTEEAPPRPPLPAELTPPPRPPTPTQDEELERVFQHQPQDNQPIMMAAHDLHQEVKHWESSDNELIQAAKQMALLMAKLSELVRGERGSKKELIDTAKAIAEASDVVTRLAKGLAAECTDKRVRTNLLQVCERIPTIGTQLKILSTVKATMLGAQGSQEDEEATEMLVGNAQNLMHAVRDAVHAAEGASIKIRVQSGYSIRWVRRRPWYT